MAEIEQAMPPLRDLDEARPDAAFRVVADTAYLWFEPRGDVLLVAFDNLATLDEPYPRLPWLHRQAGELGYSLLGVQSHAKDWFRQETAPGHIRSLAEGGFFRGFSRVVFTGASMGGFAALNFAPLVPGAAVLAFSPQSTMSRKIAPFERRFPWAVRNSDWERPEYLDAAEAVQQIDNAAILFDPFVPEDKAHAARLAGPGVQMVRLGHATHEAVRVVIKSGALELALREFAETGQLGHRFWQQMRKRRTVRKWARSLVDAAMHSGHPKLTLGAAQVLIDQDNYLFALKARDEILSEYPEIEARKRVAG
jgi:hypothetical protein